jgi:hypothetical protein
VERQLRKLIQSETFTDLPQLLAGPWIEFEDFHGLGFAQPDLLLHCGPCGILFEAKLSRTAQAEWELRELYAPLVQQVWAFDHLYLCEVFKNSNGFLNCPVANPLQLLSDKPSTEQLYQWQLLS